MHVINPQMFSSGTSETDHKLTNPGSPKRDHLNRGDDEHKFKLTKLSTINDELPNLRCLVEPMGRPSKPRRGTNSL